jgi:hypothetical protein
MRWLSRNVPLALRWSTTNHAPRRHSICACRRETEPSFTYTSQPGSRPTTAVSFVTTRGVPKAGTRRRTDMSFLFEARGKF